MKSYQFTVDDLMRQSVARLITFRCYTRQRIIWMGLMWLYFTIIIAAFVLTFGGGDFLLVALIAGAVIGLLLAMGLSYWLTNASIKRMIKLVGNEFMVSASARALRWGSSKISSTYSYDTVKNYLEYNDFVVLFLNAKLYIFVPKNKDSAPLLAAIRQKLPYESNE